MQATEVPSKSPVSSEVTSSPTDSPVTSLPTSSPSTSPVNAPACSDYDGNKVGCQSAGTGTECTYDNKDKLCTGDLPSPTVSPSRSPVAPEVTSSPSTSPVTFVPTSSPSMPPVTSSPTDVPSASPVTNSPSTSPTTSNPTLSPSLPPITPGMGYCSHNSAVQCLSVTDCNGCQEVQEEAVQQQVPYPWVSGRRNLRTNKEATTGQQHQHRKLPAPQCDDGTCRKKCSDCSSAGPECNPNHPNSCVASLPTNVPTDAPSKSPITSQVRERFILYLTYELESIHPS